MSLGVPRARRGILAATAAVLCLCAFGAAQATAQKTITLRIAYNPNPTNTTLVVADKQGFFKANGLDVKLTPNPAAAALIPALGKQFDMTTATPTDVLRGFANGLKTIVVMGQTHETPTARSSYLITTQGIGAITDLKGKTIGVPSLAGALYASTVIQLSEAGIKATDVKWAQIPFGNMADALKRGTADAVVTITPFNKQLLGQGFKDLMNPVMKTIGDKETLSAMWAANRDWASKNADAIARFRKAQRDALAWIKSHDTEARAYLTSEFAIPAPVAKTYPLTTFVYYHAYARFFTPWVAPMQKAGLLNKKFSVKSVPKLVLKGA